MAKAYGISEDVIPITVFVCELIQFDYFFFSFIKLH